MCSTKLGPRKSLGRRGCSSPSSYVPIHIACILIQPVESRPGWADPGRPRKEPTRSRQYLTNVRNNSVGRPTLMISRVAVFRSSSVCPSVCLSTCYTLEARTTRRVKSCPSPSAQTPSTHVRCTQTCDNPLRIRRTV